MPLVIRVLKAWYQKHIVAGWVDIFEGVELAEALFLEESGLDTLGKRGGQTAANKRQRMS